MNRSIKFRAWDKKDKVVRGVVGMSFYHESVSVDIEYGKYLQDDAKRFELMQYTGLKDKKGKEIYEGDVVKGFDYWNGKAHRFIGQVKYVSTGFEVVGVKQYCGGHTELNMLFQVIGNIHEDPHLLECD